MPVGRLRRAPFLAHIHYAYERWRTKTVTKIVPARADKLNTKAVRRPVECLPAPPDADCYSNGCSIRCMDAWLGRLLLGGERQMEREQVEELHYITTMDNLASILQNGIVCHNQAKHLQHTSIANEGVQDLRRGKRVPGGSLLHDYANLYFDARNAMMYDRRTNQPDLVVICVGPSVLDLPGVVISDGNAATGGTAFYPAPAGLRQLDASRVYAVSWHRDDDGHPYEGWDKKERKRQRQAEVLVPGSVPPEFITRCYVRSRAIISECTVIDGQLTVAVHKRVFFDD